jgi:8-oxo-dGTP pyrophosphatase MutT (NUDIX family)
MRVTKKAITRAGVQYAALPYRATESSDIEVLLVTSRTTKRWIIPKGWPLAGKPPHATAAREAFEEAGLIGRVTKRPIGSFSYVKRVKSGAGIECEVHVFPMEVTAQKRNWPEKGKREVQWFSTTDAAATIQDPVLRKLIKSFEAGQLSPEQLSAGRRSRG